MTSNEPWGSSLSTTEATVEVPVTTVDQLLTGKPAPLLWKVDVEGFEPQVLQGATHALHNPDYSPRGEPVVDVVLPEMLRERKWWWLVP